MPSVRHYAPSASDPSLLRRRDYSGGSYALRSGRRYDRESEPEDDEDVDEDEEGEEGEGVRVDVVPSAMGSGYEIVSRADESGGSGKGRSAGKVRRGKR